MSRFFPATVRARSLMRTLSVPHLKRGAQIISIVALGLELSVARIRVTLEANIVVKGSKVQTYVLSITLPMTIQTLALGTELPPTSNSARNGIEAGLTEPGRVSKGRTDRGCDAIRL